METNISSNWFKYTNCRKSKKIGKFLEKDEPFMLTYGDGLSNVNILKLLNFHKKIKSWQQ